MNKYLKILMLSGGLVGAISATAFDIDKSVTNDLNGIYTQVEKMQATLPRLSRINYKLNISLDDNVNGFENTDKIITNTEQSTDNSTTLDTANDENNEIIKNSTDSMSNMGNTINGYENVDDSNNIENNLNNKSNNITFSATDNNGNPTILSNDETLNYLNETLNQTNIEYEQLKNTLSKAIKDTMDYLDDYKSGEKTLTNEQKIYIKQHTNSIKFLAETLEDLSEDVLCCIDGCENCDENEFEVTASQYLITINKLEERINALNSAIASLQFVNNIGNPYFFAGHVSPNYLKYNTNKSTEQSNDNNYSNNDNISVNENQNNDNTNTDDKVDSNDNNTNNSVENTETTQDNEQINTINEKSNTDKPTTFGLKSNIDTYAPTRRNIDTFYNTALYNNEYINGNGYGYPYGVPYGGYGYGMPYGGTYGNPYGSGMGLNSNVVNREVLDNQNLNSNHTFNANIQQTEDENKDIQKPKRIPTKRAKNIDTYTETSIKSNVNTMGESRISKFFKQKFDNLRNKVQRKKGENTSPIQNNENITDNVDEQNLLNPNNINQDMEKTNNLSDTSSLSSNIDITDNLQQQKDITAQ